MITPPLEEYVRRLRETFVYSTGGLYCAKSGLGRSKGRRFGARRKGVGYRYGMFLGVQTYEHRLVWLYHHGEWPVQIDHINGVRDDNSIENLRNDPDRGNMQNCGIGARNTSGYVGVSYEAKRNGRKKWMAQISLNGKSKNLGRYLTAEEAAAAYSAAKAVLHTFHPAPVTRKSHQE